MACRPSLTAFVCPYAPFLVPRGCRPFLRLLERKGLLYYATKSKPHSPVQRPSKFLTRVKRTQEAQQKRAEKYAMPKSSQRLELLNHYRDMLSRGNLEEVMQMYPQMIAHSLLRPMDTLKTVQHLHYNYRIKSSERFQVPQLLDFANILVRDLQSRVLPPHCTANLHLLSFYKESEQYTVGVDLWNWLVAQNEEYVDAGVYGAAIELFAYQGKMELAQLEQLYQSALKRFPGNFSAYHLLPDAVVPDRTQLLTITEIPVTLVQGIVTARLIYGDWRNAYVGLDTILRLYPTQTPLRMFEIFMEHRPLAEGFKVLSMACRSGLCPSPHKMTWFLNDFAIAIRRNSVPNQLLLLKGMATTIQAYVGAGGGLSSPHLGVFVKALDMLVPERVSGSKNENIDDRSRELVVALAEQVMSVFYYAGIPPSLPLMSSLIGLAGKAGQTDMVVTNLQMLRGQPTGMSNIQHRVALFAAGQIGNPRLLETIWGDLVENARAKGEQIDAKDWGVLAHAGWMAQHATFVEQQMHELKHTLTEEIEKNVRISLKKYVKPMSDPLKEIGNDNLEAHFQDLMKTFSNVLELIQADNRIQDFEKAPLPMSLGPQRDLGSEEALRNVYDKLSTDPHRAPPQVDPSKPKLITSTAIPLGELRYKNWKAINELLDSAQSYEAARARAVENAAKNESHFDREVFAQNLRWYVPEEKASESVQQASTAEGDAQLEQSAPTQEDEAAVFNRIVALRGLSTS